ncbi:hypothetical protein TH66_04560 [Carbonactinospora thermoautotrophica]|uniref:Prevent-host-death family protein n=1 Tax=Carbonactinospora thermoautotrophica TaxID=1469144 RepID=A0A132N661_9ACTN|nr:hypothetical protein [Carbonactinospora thermoautotrophica]KWX05032.1 hypothetical protein TH66_04560 [Carbonactinospora thermoautotrophica]KWX07213.1 hypothetical protein TR74_19445 [Carbonactinospora thermoautotrophica]
MANSIKEIPFSQLVQKPRETVEELHSGRIRAVRLHRRDGEDLLLMPAARAEQEHSAMDAVTRLFVSLLKTDDGARNLLQALPDIFPWVRFLPEQDVREFLVELVEVARASVSVDNLAPLAQLITEWQHTAEVYADPELRAAFSQPIEDFGPVPDPKD